MRIIGYIEHPVFKITVFKMDNKLSVKFENPLYEQTYKFRTGEGLDTLEAVEQWVDADLLRHVEAQFAAMHQARMAALSRLDAGAGDALPFPDIV